MPFLSSLTHENVSDRGIPLSNLAKSVSRSREMTQELKDENKKTSSSIPILNQSTPTPLSSTLDYSKLRNGLYDYSQWVLTESVKDDGDDKVELKACALLSAIRGHITGRGSDPAWLRIK